MWRGSLKWVVLWLTLSVLTVLNSVALVRSLVCKPACCCLRRLLLLPIRERACTGSATARHQSSPSWLQVMVLDNDIFAIVCAAMFCWSGVLGLIGGLRTLLSHGLAQRMEPVQAVRSYSLKARPAELLCAGHPTAAACGGPASRLGACVPAAVRAS